MSIGKTLIAFTTVAMAEGDDARMAIGVKGHWHNGYERQHEYLLHEKFIRRATNI